MKVIWKYPHHSHAIISHFCLPHSDMFNRRSFAYFPFVSGVSQNHEPRLYFNVIFPKIFLHKLYINSISSSGWNVQFWNSAMFAFRKQLLTCPDYSTSPVADWSRIFLSIKHIQKEDEIYLSAILRGHWMIRGKTVHQNWNTYVFGKLDLISIAKSKHDYLFTLPTT